MLIFTIPSGLTYTLGTHDGLSEARLGRLGAMAILFLAGVPVAYWAEADGNPLLARDRPARASAMQSGGNMEGKEVRFGIANSALYATVTTDASCGGVNRMHDSFTPLGGMVPLINIMLGEVVFGGVGAGLYGIVVFVILAVFIAGLMVGRTPEYLGKKIEAYDVKMAMLSVLDLLPVDSGFHRHCRRHKFGTLQHFKRRSARTLQVLYAYTSSTGNNGSAFAGLNGNTLGITSALAFAMLLGRFLQHIPDPRDRRQSGAEETRARFRRNIPGDDATFHFLADLRHPDRQRTDFLPRAQPGPDSRAPADERRKGFLRTP